MRSQRSNRNGSWRAAVAAAVLIATTLAHASSASAQQPDGDGYPAAPLGTPIAPPSLLDRLTPSFSTAPRSMFRRRGPRGATYDYSRQSVWWSANVHDFLPRGAAAYWPAPLRLSAGRRGLGAGLPAEYAVGLDLDASRLPGTHPAWMRTKQLLHMLRLPGPAVVIGPDGTRVMALYW